MEIALVLVCLGLIILSPNVAANKAETVKMKVTNNAGSPINLYWVNEFAGKEKSGEFPIVEQTTKPLRNNSVTVINSYNTHLFRASFIDNKEQFVEFRKGPREESIFIQWSDEKNEMEAISRTKYHEILDTVMDGTYACDHLKERKLFSDCVTKHLMEDIDEMLESSNRMTTFRDLMSDRLRNYTCMDAEMNSSKIESSTVIELATSKENVMINKILNTETTKIVTIDDFVSSEQCSILMDHSRTRLQRATVAAEDGSSIISNNRRASQASYDFNRSDYLDDPLWPLYLRIVDVANAVGSYDIQPEGQEYFTIIQYGKDDEYRPHCDGACDGSDYQKNGRVATAILYCEIPEEGGGGGTTFTNADVFIKPKKNMALFFTYKAKDGRMDDSLSEHSGCPIIDGEKWIATAWLREGISFDNPADLYDPDGILLSLQNEDEDEDEDEERQEAGINMLGETI